VLIPKNRHRLLQLLCNANHLRRHRHQVHQGRHRRLLLQGNQLQQLVV
jgi:hypothetical protein